MLSQGQIAPANIDLILRLHLPFIIHQHEYKYAGTQRKAEIFQQWETNQQTNHYFRVILEMGSDYMWASLFL